MSQSSLNVLHVVGADTPCSRLSALRVLLAHPEIGRQRVVQFGGGHVDSAGLGKVERLCAPLGIGWLVGRDLHSLTPARGPSVLHLWSPKALSWVLPATESERRAAPDEAGANHHVLMDVELPADLPGLARGFSPLWSDGTLRFVCPTDTLRRRLLETGVPADHCALIRDSVDFAAINAARRSDLRSRLEISPDDAAVLIVPPVLRETGALVAAWGALILENVRPGVRLILPGTGREVERVSRLIDSSEYRATRRRTGRRLSVSELVTAADLALYLPAGDATLSGLAWAQAAGTPIVASAVPATTELLAHGLNAWLCRADSPKDAARRMLQALEHPQQSKRQADLARVQAFELYSRRRMIEQYRRVYANLLSGRRLAEGLEQLVEVR